MEFERVKCVVCASDDVTLVSKTGQFGLPANVCVCNRCGLSYLNPRWTKERYNHFYSKEYDKYYRVQVINNDGSGFDPDEHENNPYGFYPVLKRIENRLTEVRRIMDLGAGNGENIRYLMAKLDNIQAFAIESSEECIRTLQANSINVISNDIDSNWEERIDGTLDLVIMRHVFEHMLNPVETLKKIKKSLRADGLIYIAVPNAIKIEEPVLSSFFRVVHTYYYSPRSIENLLILGGFELLELVEGDEFNKREMWLIAKSSNHSSEPVIEKSNSIEQLNYYQAKIGPEKNINASINRWFKQRIVQPTVRLKKSILP